MTVRTVVLEDLSTGVRLPPKVNRLNLYHGKAMIELLMLAEEDAESSASPAS